MGKDSLLMSSVICGQTTMWSIIVSRDSLFNSMYPNAVTRAAKKRFEEILLVFVVLAPPRTGRLDVRLAALSTHVLAHLHIVGIKVKAF